MLFFLLIILGFAFYVMSSEERRRVALAVLGFLRQLDAASQGPPDGAWRSALHARTRWALVTPSLVALNVLIFLSMKIGADMGDAQALVDWGANFGPRTTNGEWWRLLTATFVHAGMLHLLANMGGLLQLGLILERIVGHYAFGAVYVAAGLFASLVSLSTDPVAVTAGASGAVFGIYGLALASCVGGVVGRATVQIPLVVLARLAPGAALFFLYNLASGALPGTAEFVGLLTGFVGGLIAAQGGAEDKPPARRIAAGAAATIVIVVACAVPLRSIADVRPEIARILDLEGRMADAYQASVARFRDGRIDAGALAQLIDRTILPELRAAHARLQALDGVPREHQPLVEAADEYFRRREDGWRRRAEALRKASMPALREADRAEAAALQALQRIRSN
jgi:rhomboid protease GluP